MLSVRFLLRFAGMAVVILQARLLHPADFGIFAMSMSVVGLADVLCNFQVGTVLIRMEDPSDDHLHTAFTLGLLRGLLVAAVLILTAPLTALLVNSPETAAVIAAMSVLPLIDSLRSARMILYERDIDFSRENVTRLVQAVGTWVATIALAYIYQNYWALVGGVIAGRAAGVLLSYGLAPVLPRMTLRHARALFGFSGWMMGAAVINYICERAETLILARVLGMRSLGIYEMGYNLSATVVFEISDIFIRVLYPGFSRQAGDIEKLRLSFAESQAIIFDVVLPFGVGLALVAPELVVVLTGERWLGIVPVISIIAPFLALFSLHRSFPALMMALNKPKVMAAQRAVMLGVRTPLLAAGAIWFRLIGFTVARAFDGLIDLCMSLAIIRRELSLSYSSMLVRLWLPLSAVTCMSIAVYGLGMYIARHDITLSTWALLIVKILCGVVVYTLTHVALWALSGRPKFGLEYRLMEMMRGRQHASKAPI